MWLVAKETPSLDSKYSMTVWSPRQYPVLIAAV